MTKEQTIEGVVQRVDKILSIDIDTQIINQKKFGELNGFSPIKTDFVQLYQLLGLVKSSDLSLVPSVLLEEFLSPLDNLESVLINMVKLVVRTNENSITNFVNQFKASSRDVATRAISLLALIGTLERPQPQLEIDKKRNDFAKFLDESKDDAKKQLDAAKDVIARLSDQAKNIGVLSYTTAFTEEAGIFRRTANWWLFFSVLFFLAIVVTGVVILAFPEVITKGMIAEDGSAHVYEIIQASIIRLLIVSALFYSLTTSVKTYKANKHNEILNNHRHNALAAFEAFSNAPSADATTKNAVLLEATHAIFGHQITGFTTGEKDSEVPIKILEVLRPSSTSSNH